MKLSLFAVAALITLPLTSVLADTVSLPVSADTWMFPEAPDNNMGGADNFACGVNAHGSPMRTLLKFDVSSIPVGSTINSVTVSLTITKANVIGNTTYELHRLLVEWGEGTGTGNTGSPANPGEATWNDRINLTNSWTIAGGSSGDDFASTASASMVVSTPQTYTFNSTSQLVADVQAWVNDSNANSGWMFKAQVETPGETARRWGSRESTSGPALSVNFTPPPSPPTITNVFVSNNRIHFSFIAQANKTYAVESRGSLSSGTWNTVSNYTASPSITTANFLDLLSSNQFYRVRTP